MKNRKTLLAAFAALLFTATAHAGLSGLAVNFAPDANDYFVGETVNVTAAGNGTGMQYAFVLDKIVARLPVRVNERFWGLGADYAVDTATLSAGTYRLTVKAREKANYRETLVKTEYFNVLEATAAGPACERIKGKTYTNPAPVAPTVDLGCAGFICLGALDAFMAPGYALPAASHAAALGSVTFGNNGTIRITTTSINITSTHGNGQISGSLNGTYACADGVVSYDVSGTGTLTGSSGVLGLFNGQDLFLRSSGSLTIDGMLDTLSAGGVVFE